MSEFKERVRRRIAKASTKLDLSACELRELPAEICQLTKLTHLDVSQNELTKLPAEIGVLKQLIRLNVGYNELSELPAEIGQLTRLIQLELINNQLSELPVEIGRLTQLTHLDLDDNQLGELPTEIGRLTQLTRLDLLGNQLKALPAEIGQLAQLRYLDLDSNQLSALPAEIGRLTQLVDLDVRSNRLSELPAEIGQLTQLDELNLQSNELSELPVEIGQLAQLVVLTLQNNRLSELPAEIGQLTRLTELNLHSNRLQALPRQIGRLTRLADLNLRSNRLRALPLDIGQLTQLRYLDLGANELSELPAEIGELAHLIQLRLMDNRLPRSYSDAFTDGGISALDSLLRSLEVESAPLYEAKLLVTGEGSVGKSWALAALQGKDPAETVGEQTTYGIDRGELALPHPELEDATIALNTWDFGGQKIYRVTHQFFFSEDALFLLAWNPRQGAEQCQVRQWLRRIALRTGGNAKVIMVATHCPADRTPYRPEYGHDALPQDLQAIIVASIAIDSKIKPDGQEGDNIQELRDLIAEHAAKLPRMGEPFSPGWKAARKAAVALKDHEPYIKYERFARICEEAGKITDPDQMFTLARVFMHKLGRAVYYGERGDVQDGTSGSPNGEGPQFHDVHLANILVLDAEWLSKAFVQVLEDEPTKASGGMLDHGRLDLIWRTHGRDDWTVYEPPEHHYLIRLMRAFDVSYVVKGSGGERSLVAQMLPERRPDLPWVEPPLNSGEPVLRLVCELKHEAPGLMPRFIVHSEPYHLIGEGGRGLFWTEGVFLEEGTFHNQALVTIEGTERPIVTITIHGPQPGWFLGELYRTLDSLLSFWPGLKKTYSVLCSTVREDGGLCSGRFEFDFLVQEQREHPGDNQICQSCRIRRKPAELLSGFSGVKEQRQQRVQTALEYSLARKQALCPRLFTITPVARRWYDPRKVKSLVGKELQLTLLSEHSCSAVVSKVFTVKKGWVKWFGPVVRLTSLALAGAAVPLAGEAAQQLSEASSFMAGVGGISTPEGARRGKEQEREVRHAWASGAQLRVLETFLKELELAPGFGGMEFVKIKGKGYLWVSAEEAASHAEETPVLAYVPQRPGPSSSS